MVVSKTLSYILVWTGYLIVSQLLPQIYYSTTYATYRRCSSHYLLAENVSGECQPGCLDCHLHGGNHLDQLLRREAFR